MKTEAEKKRVIDFLNNLAQMVQDDEIYIYHVRTKAHMKEGADDAGVMKIYQPSGIETVMITYHRKVSEK